MIIDAATASESGPVMDSLFTMVESQYFAYIYVDIFMTNMLITFNKVSVLLVLPVVAVTAFRV
jgi:hypothetical protein